MENDVKRYGREQKISEFIRRTGADVETAVAYLDAEEWFVDDAVISYRGDHRR